MEQYNTIQWEIVEKGLGVLTLNRPKAYNSVNGEMLDELQAFWHTRLYDLETLVIILKGNGEKGFCAGLDMKYTVENMDLFRQANEFYKFQARLGRLNLAMRRAPQPIIGLIHGAAAGVGFSFALASDIRIISPDARFCAAYINIGLGGADMCCSYLLPRIIGAGRAYEIMYLGEFISSEEAMNLGMISRIVPREDLYATGLQIARTMLSKNHFALRLTKEAINMNLDAGGMEQALNMEDRNQVLITLASGLKSTV
ncbi:MAG TPA: enoyl-CoA hydratase/isomerase family protein [Smithella sp.]|nr:enoyl-CoA hydratase/isomerase family protein [Smithella sp.]MDM7987953.1 enoyl-CoA hydratase/isomerase family protein [Smithella sp.]HNY50638.1 enoyl-CoA hydratase/isomerase family protein [Smithella sp.]HOG89205.1 enoyl-CoA hydratase/isomerase family protein [Smithella sp.]HOU49957.1 enoyl-CoA hydratase/isomerase family protein [Smithella sp.]